MSSGTLNLLNSTQLKSGGCSWQVYSGYVDDARNTDNAWMEAVIYNFHDETGEYVGRLQLHAGNIMVLLITGTDRQTAFIVVVVVEREPDISCIKNIGRRVLKMSDNFSTNQNN